MHVSDCERRRQRPICVLAVADKERSGSRVFDGLMLDVAIGLLLLFLVVSLMASAIVEAVGGFLHRRQKHLWDTLDLLLGTTSPLADSEQDPVKVVEDLYKTPFITGLVRPSDRTRFDPATHTTNSAQPTAAKRAAPRTPPLGQRPKSRATGTELDRRFYGPAHIHATEFANALLTWIRPSGSVDKALSAVAALEPHTASSGDVALTEVQQSLEDLKAAATALRATDLVTAAQRILDAGAVINGDDLRNLHSDATRLFGRLGHGELTVPNVLAAVELLPHDLRTKLTAVIEAAGTSFIDMRVGIENWFDRHMEAGSAWYRKQTRWFLFVAGLALAASFNIDTIHAATTLYRDHDARAAVVGIAEKVGEASCPAKKTSGDTNATAAVPATSSGLDLECVRGTVGGAVALPIGWDNFDGHAGAWTLRILGWLIVAGAVTLGSPFWFDLLRRALNVRRTQGGAT